MSMLIGENGPSSVCRTSNNNNGHNINNSTTATQPHVSTGPHKTHKHTHTPHYDTHRGRISPFPQWIRQCFHTTFRITDDGGGSSSSSHGDPFRPSSLRFCEAEEKANDHMPLNKGRGLIKRFLRVHWGSAAKRQMNSYVNVSKYMVQ